MKSLLSPIRIAIGIAALAVVAASAIYFLGLEATIDLDPLYDEVPEEAERVLFVGNSHTFRNSLPQMVQRIAHSDERARPIATAQLSPPGATLYDHTQNPRVARALKSGSFDFAVIQPASLEPVVWADSFVVSFRHLAGWAKEGQTRPVLYEVWPRAQHNTALAEPAVPDTPELVARAIAQSSERALAETDALHAPAGRAWESSRRRATGITLYANDGNHAAPAGTYLAALVIYATIRQKPLPDNLWRPRYVDDDAARQLIGIANTTTK